MALKRSTGSAPTEPPKTNGLSADLKRRKSADASISIEHVAQQRPQDLACVTVSVPFQALPFDDHQRQLDQALELLADVRHGGRRHGNTGVQEGLVGGEC